MSARVIWKFPLRILDEQTVEMPADAVLLSVAEQTDVVCLWAEVVPDRPTEKRRILIHGTGHAISGEPRFIGTVLALDGRLVLHLYDGGTV